MSFFMMQIKMIVLLFTLLISLTCGALTPAQRQEFVDIHNYLRRSVVPEASDMQELVYDTVIEDKVNDYLNLCKFEHRRLDGYGENGRLATDSNITNTVFSWFQERVYYDILIPNEDPKGCSKENSQIDYLGEVQCGHYKIMVKSTLVSLGCGIKFCSNITAGTESYKDNYITFCFYNSGQKNPPYEIGKPCSGCNIGFGFCYKDLCVKDNSYDKTKVDCRLQCYNCGEHFNYPSSCLCDCPRGTNGGSCSGTPKSPVRNCSPCKRINATCLNGGKEESSVDQCKCTCQEGFQGDVCEVRKDVYSNSYEYALDGIPWRYNMTTPANIIQFKTSYKEFQTTISKDVYDLCIKKYSVPSEDIRSLCKNVSGSIIPPDNVIMVPGYPILNKNGSLIMRIFIKYSRDAANSKQEEFVSPVIIGQVLRQPSEALNNLFEADRAIYPKDTGTSSTTTKSDIGTSSTTTKSDIGTSSTTTKSGTTKSSFPSAAAKIPILMLSSLLTIMY